VAALDDRGALERAALGKANLQRYQYYLDRDAIRDTAIEQCAAKIESSVDLSGLVSDLALMNYTAEMVKCCAEIIRTLKSGEGK
jgi:hypothetical protein